METFFFFFLLSYGVDTKTRTFITNRKSIFRVKKKKNSLSKTIITILHYTRKLK